MRRMTYAAAAVMLAGALACRPQDRQGTANRAESAANEVGEEAREFRDYGYAQRNEFRRDMDVRLKGIDAEIAELERDTKRGLDKTRDSALVNIRAARKGVAQHLNRLG